MAAVRIDQRRHPRNGHRVRPHNFGSVQHPHPLTQTPQLAPARAAWWEVITTACGGVWLDSPIAPLHGPLTG